MLLAWNTVLLSPAHLLGFLGDDGVQQLHLVFSISPFWFDHAGQNGIESHIIIHVL